MTDGSNRLYFLSGPSIYKKDKWGLSIVFHRDLFGEPSPARELALEGRRSGGYDPRTRMK